MHPTVGIYKIQSPTGKVYIGQSWDIHKRFSQHKYSHSDTYVSRSIKKYGADNHSFQVVHELPKDCNQQVLTQYEQVYMDFHKVAGFIMLNNRDAGSTGKMSELTKEKMRISMKGRRISDNAKLLLSAHRKGKPLSEEHKAKLKASSIGKNKGGIRSEVTREKMRIARTGIKASDATRLKQSNIKKGKKLSEEHRANMSKSNRNARKVLDTSTGVIYSTIVKAAGYLGIDHRNLQSKLCGRKANKTTFIYYDTKPNPQANKNNNPGTQAGKKL